MKSEEETDSERTGGAKASSAGRDVGDRSDLNTSGDVEFAQRGPDDGMFDAIDRIDFFGSGVADADAMVEFLINVDVNEFVYGGGNDCSSKAAIEGRKIASAAGKADAQRCLGDDHVCGNAVRR